MGKISVEEWKKIVAARKEIVAKLEKEVWEAIWKACRDYVDEGFAADVADMFAKPVANLAVSLSYTFGYPGEPWEDEWDEE